MKTCQGVFVAALTAAAVTAFGADDEWVFEGDISRDPAVTRAVPLEGGPFFSSGWGEGAAVNDWGEFIRMTWVEEPSNAVLGFDSTIVPGFLLFLR